MQVLQSSHRTIVALMLVLLPATMPVSPGWTAESQESTQNEAPGSDDFSTETIRGHFVWLAEAQERLYGVRSVPEAKDRLLALETADGELVPLIEDVRGRAFRADERLRNLQDCELVVRRFPKSPLVQIMKVYSYEDGVKYEIDYYCEICSIVMFELKVCECCQGQIELRKQPVK